MSYSSYYGGGGGGGGSGGYPSYDESFGHSGSFQSQNSQGGGCYGHNHHQDYYHQQPPPHELERGYGYYGGCNSDYDGNFGTDHYAPNHHWSQDHQHVLPGEEAADMG